MVARTEAVVVRKRISIGLVGDYDKSVPAHQVAEDEEGEVRAVELDNHPFFVATLFQPERAALAGKSVPLAFALVGTCAA